jgi:hypothetical protein
MVRPHTLPYLHINLYASEVTNVSCSACRVSVRNTRIASARMGDPSEEFVSPKHGEAHTLET